MSEHPSKPGLGMRALGFLAADAAMNQFRLFHSSLKQCRRVQMRLLLRHLRRHRHTGFGKAHDFGSIGSYLDYTRAVPVANYRYFETYIERCKQGNTGALLARSEKLAMFAMTSGTTAAAKYLPVTKGFMSAYRRGWTIWGVKALMDHPGGYLRPILQISSPADQERTEAGIPCGAISGMIAEHQHPLVRRHYVTPPCVARIPDTTARYYTIMRLAIPRPVGFISTANPSTPLTLAKTAEQHAEALVRDIHDGTLSPELDIPRAIRETLEAGLRPDPEYSKTLDSIMMTHNRFIPADYWKPAFLGHWMGGSLSHYLPKLVEYYGATPMRDIGLLASEGRMSIPMEDNTPAGVLDIQSHFFEFVPADEIDRVENVLERETLPAEITTYMADQLEVGQDYYVLLTNFSGLYRYHIGDMVRVTGRIGSTGVIEFLSRGAHISSITGEKITENQVVSAVRHAADQLAIHLESFIITPQLDEPPHYRLYFESPTPFPHALLNQLSELIDSRLMVLNIEYESKRSSGRLAPMDARQLPPDFLTEMDESIRRENHGRSEQFKHRFLYNHPFDPHS